MVEHFAFAVMAAGSGDTKYSQDRAKYPLAAVLPHEQVRHKNIVSWSNNSRHPPVPWRRMRQSNGPAWLRRAERIGQPNAAWLTLPGLTLNALYQRRKHLHDSVDSLSKSNIAGEFGEPGAQMPIRVIVDILELPIFVDDTKQIERDHLFFGKASIGIIAHALTINPQFVLIILASIKINCY